jgi:hypothetical protein
VEPPIDSVVRKVRPICTRLDAKFRYKVRSLVERNGGRIGELACSQHLRAKPMLLELLDESANEYYLFHGTHGMRRSITAAKQLWFPRVAAWPAALFGAAAAVSE